MAQRLYSVTGSDGKTNDVIYHPPVTDEDGGITKHVLFFGGDVQDFVENMVGLNKEHLEWNLEATACLMHGHFPQAHTWVIKPSRMHLKSFSVYSNFVESNDFGCPTHHEGQTSLKHLMKLFGNACARIAEPPGEIVETDDSARISTCDLKNDIKSENSDSKSSGATHQLAGSSLAGSRVACKTLRKNTEFSLTFVGFSKGCVVLNQILYDMKSARNTPDDEINDFISRISDMYWLDGAHCGGSNTWVTDSEVLANFAELNIRAHAHVTPYQIRDDMRKWIGKEEAKFVKHLKELGVRVHEVVHFEQENRSIQNHFRVLKEFKSTHEH